MSYTDTHPAVHAFRCDLHHVTMSTDNLPAGLAELWEAMHADCEQEAGE